MLMKEKIMCVIEARMGSSRLPGKVLMKSNGKSMLEIMISRLRLVFSSEQIIVATSNNIKDIAIYDETKKLGVNCFQGDEDDVLHRVACACREYKADVVVLLTGDCPLIDPYIVDQCINTFMSNSVDYLSNALIRSYPDGMDTQVIRFKALERSENSTIDQLEREHSTLHLIRNPDLFSLLNFAAPTSMQWPKLGLTLDENEDFILINKIVSHFHPRLDFRLEEIMKYLNENPNLIKVNSKVMRTNIS